MKAFFRSREVRKFLGSRLAVAASLIILVYVVVGLAIAWFNVVPEDATLQRVAPNTMPGLLGRQTTEKRMLDAEFYLDTVEKALKANDPVAALAEVRFAELGVVDRPPDELAATIEEGWAIYDQLGELDVNADPAALPLVEQLEAITASILQQPTGLAALKYWARTSMGTDRQGRSISVRATYSIKVAILVGVVTAVISVLFGTLMGAAAAYFGGILDIIVIWLYSTFASIPYLVLLTVLAYMFADTIFDGTLIPIYVAFCATFWIGPCRVIRGETLKLMELEYVQAATGMGFRKFYILLRHVIPNTAHLIFINFSLLFIGAIKSEVILTFLGLGVKKGASWGMMIRASGQEVVGGFFWQIGTATVFMFGLVLAFNIFSDALQDALDPKHAG